jgi:hypothetical protein
MEDTIWDWELGTRFKTKFIGLRVKIQWQALANTFWLVSRDWLNMVKLLYSVEQDELVTVSPDVKSINL